MASQGDAFEVERIQKSDQLFPNAFHLDFTTYSLCVIHTDLYFKFNSAVRNVQPHLPIITFTISSEKVS